MAKDPNLQNIPVRTEEGRKIRRAFTRAVAVVDADFSQMEQRILAEVAEANGYIWAEVVEMKPMPLWVVATEESYDLYTGQDVQNKNLMDGWLELQPPFHEVGLTAPYIDY